MDKKSLKSDILANYEFQFATVAAVRPFPKVYFTMTKESRPVTSMIRPVASGCCLRQANVDFIAERGEEGRAASVSTFTATWSGFTGSQVLLLLEKPA